MNTKEALKHLDRAFTQAPPELSSSVEEAFRRGERAMKKRYKFMTAVSVAALLAVLFAALALATGQFTKSRVDRVVTSQRDGGGTGGRATRPRNTPRITPSPTPTPAPTPEPEQAATAARSDDAAAADAEMLAYYATQQGRYFHLDEHCGGMQNALPCALNTVQVMGKEACPICVDGDELSEMPCYATEFGKYYHQFEDCSGMKGARRGSLEAAQASGKGACPVCLPANPKFCWANPWGTYYHSDRECMGMRNAQVYTQVYAAHMGKKPCPICSEGNAASTAKAAFGGSEETAAPQARSADVPAPEAAEAYGTAEVPDEALEPTARRYVAEGDAHYHADMVCEAIRDRAVSACSRNEAVARGKTRCPLCQPDAPDDIGLFRRAFGCELGDLWPGHEYAFARRTPYDGDLNWYLLEKGTEDIYTVCAVLETRTVEDADGTGHDARNEVSTPENFVEGDVRMKLWQNNDADYIEMLRRAPEPLGTLVAEAEARLSGMPAMEKPDGSSPLAWNDWVYVCFDAARTAIKAVDLYVDGPDVVRFQWLRQDDGTYDLSRLEVNGEGQE